MNSNRKAEHFVTLFDSNFLPMGIALHESLMSHAQPFHLWIICMDEQVEEQLQLISLSNTTLIPLRQVETGRLIEVKSARTRVEYCWTLTPFGHQAVFELAPEVERVTYVDADVFFFADPENLLQRFARSGKHVMITEHGYDPKYDQSNTSGRFCVQFLTIRNSPQALKVMKWWQERCLEWCFERLEDGKFGDQKYLDIWPELFDDEVYILEDVKKTLAPWNVDHIFMQDGVRLDPVFYHFHSCRIVAPRMVRLFVGYKLSEHAYSFYKIYLSALRRSCDILTQVGIPIPYIPERSDFLTRLRFIKHKIAGTTQVAPI
jgi:hypothetical protein